MRLNVDRTWYERNVGLEEGAEVSAGPLTPDTLMAELAHVRGQRECGGTRQALAWLINLRRRERQLSLEGLAEKADIDLRELWCIEQAEEMDLAPRTVYQLAEVLHLPAAKLMQLSGLTTEQD